MTRTINETIVPAARGERRSVGFRGELRRGRTRRHALRNRIRRSVRTRSAGRLVHLSAERSRKSSSQRRATVNGSRSGGRRRRCSGQHLRGEQQQPATTATPTCSPQPDSLHDIEVFGPGGERRRGISRASFDRISDRGSGRRHERSSRASRGFGISTVVNASFAVLPAEFDDHADGVVRRDRHRALRRQSRDDGHAPFAERLEAAAGRERPRRSYACGAAVIAKRVGRHEAHRVRLEEPLRHIA